MKHFRPIFLTSAVFVLLFVVGIGMRQWQIADAQNKPLTYPEITTALNTKLPNETFKTKTELINFLIAQIKQRKVDKPLTADREDDLRQTGATDELIAAIRENSPPISTIPRRDPTITVKPREAVSENSVAMEFVRISSGSFMMGGERNEDEKPVHRVNINYEFYIGKYEVTIGEWKKVMGDLPEDMKTKAEPKFKESDRQPVTMVSWNDVKTFLARLNAGNDGFTYRLPTEAEWEYACRAGTTTEFSFGNSLTKSQANIENSAEKTVAVGSYRPNDWGLYDMHGNVWEWVEDIYSSDYRNAPTDGSANLTNGDFSLRVLRGGSWKFESKFSTSAIRNTHTQTSREGGSGSYGFRVVRVSSKSNSTSTVAETDTLKRANDYLNRGEYVSAIAEYDKEIRQNPQSVEAFLKRGYAYYYLGGVDETAYASFREAIRIRPSLASENYLKCAFFDYPRDEQETKDTITTCTAAINENPSFSLSYAKRGEAYYYLPNYDNAIADYTRAIELNPYFAGAYNTRGWTYELTKNYSKAIADYRKALEINPNHKAAKNNLDRILKESY